MKRISDLNSRPGTVRINMSMSVNISVLLLLLTYTTTTITTADARIFPFSPPWSQTSSGNVKDPRGGSTLAKPPPSKRTVTRSFFLRPFGAPETVKEEQKAKSPEKKKQEQQQQQKQVVKKPQEISKKTQINSATVSGGASVMPLSEGAQPMDDYIAVTTLVWGSAERNVMSFFQSNEGTNDYAISPGCQIRGIKDSGWSSSSSSASPSTTQFRGVWNRNTPALWKSVSFLSDVTVLVLDTRDPLDPALVRALQAGFAARLKDSALPKGHLLVVLKTNEDDENAAPGIINAWKQRLAVSDLSGLSPKILETIQIVTVANYEKTLSDLVSTLSKGGVCRMADTATFPSLLKQVHRAFGGGNKALLQPQSQSLVSTMERVTAAAVESWGRSRGAASTASSSPASALTSTSTLTRESEALVEARLLDMVQQQMEDLQRQLEDSWLETSTSSRTAGAPMPLNFAARANPILAKLERHIHAKNVPATVRASIIVQMGTRLRQLYQQQLQALREYYGRLYESLLERASTNNGAASTEAWREAATRVTERFRKAAADSMPYLAHPGKLLDGADLESAAALSESGLVADLMEAMVQREEDVLEAQEQQQADGELEYLDSSSSASATAVKKQKTWHKKLAARVLVFGVNYLQGWLAWQDIKRAALEREKQMPKFPLF